MTNNDQKEAFDRYARGYQLYREMTSDDRHDPDFCPIEHMGKVLEALQDRLGFNEEQIEEWYLRFFDHASEIVQNDPKLKALVDSLPLPNFDHLLDDDDA